MIHKIVGTRPSGNATFGLIRYVLDKRVKDETAEIIGGNMMGRYTAELNREMRVCEQLKPDIKEPTFHSVISLPEGEHLTNEQWQEVGTEYLKKLGFDTDRNPFFLVKHTNTDKEHIHIVASKISIDGQNISLHNDRYKGMSVMREFEKKFNLQPTKTIKNKTKSTTAEKGRAARKKQDLTTKEHIQNVIDNVLNTYTVDLRTTDGQEFFKQQLKAQDIDTKFNINAKGVSGVSFVYDDMAYSGTKLGTDYKTNNLIKRGLATKTEQEQSDALIADETKYIEMRLEIGSLSFDNNPESYENQDAYEKALADYKKELLTEYRELKTEQTSPAPTAFDDEKGTANKPQQLSLKPQQEQAQTEQETSPILQPTETTESVQSVITEPAQPAPTELDDAEKEKEFWEKYGRQKRERFINNAVRECFDQENVERIKETLKNPRNLFEKDELQRLDNVEKSVLIITEKVPSKEKEKMRANLENQGIQPVFVGLKNLISRVFNHFCNILKGIVNAAFEKLREQHATFEKLRKQHAPQSEQEIKDFEKYKEKTLQDSAENLRESPRFLTSTPCQLENLLKIAREHCPETPIIFVYTQETPMISKVCSDNAILRIQKDTDKYRDFVENPENTKDTYQNARNHILAKNHTKKAQAEVNAEVNAKIKAKQERERQRELEKTQESSQRRVRR